MKQERIVFSRKYEKSVITPEERNLIDEAVAAGRVRKIRTGRSAYSDDIVYDEASGHLRYADKEAANKRLRRKNRQ